MSLLNTLNSCPCLISWSQKRETVECKREKEVCVCVCVWEWEGGRERAVGRWCSLGPLPHLCHHGNRAVVRAGLWTPIISHLSLSFSEKTNFIAKSNSVRQEEYTALCLFNTKTNWLTIKSIHKAAYRVCSWFCAVWLQWCFMIFTCQTVQNYPIIDNI